MHLQEEIQNKWAPLINHSELPSIQSAHRKAVTAQLLENTEEAIREDASIMGGVSGSLLETSGAAPTTLAAGVQNYDPVLINLVRRAMPNLIAYDICGVQPMTGPTGLIFALRPQYD
jgi:hypothetical protein